jgi:hypothetical protein
MRRRLIILFAAFLATLPAFAQSAGNPVYEPFSDSTSLGGTSYEPGDWLAGQSQFLPEGFQGDAGGHDSVQSWWEYGTSIYTNGIVAAHQPVIVEGDLSYPGLLSMGGGRSAGFGGNGDHAMMNLPVGPGGFLTGTIYYSFVLRMTNLTGLDTNGTFFAGFTQLQSYDHPYGTPMAIGSRVWIRSDGAGGFNLGIQKGGKGPAYGPVAWETSSRAVSNTLFLTASYNLTGTAGNSGGIDDEADLWINPDLSTFGAASPPTATLAATETAGDINDLDLQRIASFILLDNADNEPAGQIDDLRIGTEWADVTPPAPASSVELQSAADPAGPYAAAPGQAVDSANKVITLPMSGGMQFYRIFGAVTITGIRISDDSVIVTYADLIR